MTAARTPVIIGPFPPPVYGSAVIDAMLEADLKPRGIAVLRIDTAAGPLRPGIGYKMRRLGVFAGAVLRALAAPARSSFLISVNGGFGLAYDIVFAAIGRLRAAPLFLYHHSARYLDRRSGLAKLLLAVAGRGATHIACSPAMFARLESLYGGDRQFLHVSNAAWIAPQPAADPQGPLTLGMLSVLNREKGLHEGLETLRRLRTAGIDARLLLAGAAPDPQDQARIEAAKQEFGGALSVLGTIGGAAKHDFFAALDVFLFPSRYRHETQSLVVPEALAAGVPVIAFDHRYVGELLGDGGLLLPLGADYPARAAAWISEQRRDGPVRQATAAQFARIHAEAAGNLDRLAASLTGAA